MKKILLVLFLVAIALVFARCVFPANAAPERPPADIFLPQIEDDLSALPIEDFMIQDPACWPPQYNRCEITISRDAFSMLKNIISPINYSGSNYRKIGHYYYTDHPSLEELIWAAGGEGLWVVTDDWRQGTIHYQ